MRCSEPRTVVYATFHKFNPSIRCQALSVAQTHPALIIWCELASHWRTEVLSLRQMTKAKMKSTAERRSSYQKPTLRSEAFARAVCKAKLRVVGSGGLRSLFEQAARQAASLPR